jgi:hypothetical protein
MSVERRTIGWVNSLVTRIETLGSKWDPHFMREEGPIAIGGMTDELRRSWACAYCGGTCVQRPCPVQAIEQKERK